MQKDKEHELNSKYDPKQFETSLYKNWEDIVKEAYNNYQDIIQNIYEGNGELKKDNYQTYFEQIEMIYSKYDYSVLD